MSCISDGLAFGCCSVGLAFPGIMTLFSSSAGCGSLFGGGPAGDGVVGDCDVDAIRSARGGSCGGGFFGSPFALFAFVNVVVVAVLGGGVRVVDFPGGGCFVGCTFLGHIGSGDGCC